MPTNFSINKILSREASTIPDFREISPPPILERMDQLPMESIELENEGTPTKIIPQELPNQIGRGKAPVEEVTKEPDVVAIATDPRASTSRGYFGEKILANPDNKKLDLAPFHGRHFTCLDAVQSRATGQYKDMAYRFLASFEFKELYKTPYPEAELCALFQKCLEYARDAAMAAKITPDHYIFLMHSPVLDYLMAVHLLSVDSNTPEMLLRQFEKVDQSNRAKQRDSVISGAFQIDVTVIQTKPKNNSSSNSNRKRKHPGAAKANHRIQPIEFKVNKKALYKIENNDNYCLFRAMLMVIAKKTMTEKRWRNYCKNEKQQEEDAKNLLHVTGIDPDLPYYDIEDFGDLIQRELLDRFYPKQNFRIFAFENAGDFKPFYKSSKSRYSTELPIFYWREDRHYDGIRSMQLLFDEESKYKYCFSCEVPYSNTLYHKMSCKSRCENCCQMGPEFPCKADENGFFKVCTECNKIFDNPFCFDHHITKKLCTKSKRCPEPDCGIIYRVDRHKKEEHKCGERHCKRCWGFHDPKRHCFMRPYEIVEENEKRFISMDFECMTDFQPDPYVMRFVHQVNFAWAHVFCTRCIDNGTWDEPLEKPCEICGKKRYFAWAPFKFDRQHQPVDHFERVDNVLAAFTEWITHFEQIELNRNGEVFSDVEAEMGIVANVNGLREIEDSSDEEPPKKKKARRSLDDEADGDEEEAIVAEKNPNEMTPEELQDHYAKIWEQIESTAADSRTKNKRKQKKKQKKFNTLAYAHAGSRYDHVFVFGEILRQSRVCPKLIRNGNRLFKMQIKEKGMTTTTFLDSHNIIPIPLSKFVKTFGMDIETKKHFPHHFNKKKNYNKTFDRHPALEEYGPGSMSAEQRADLINWYEQNENEDFCLNDTIAEYCANDVKVLSHGIVAIRKLFLEQTGIDITSSVTLASAAMKAFRSMLPRNHLAITPHMGYENRGSQSTLGRKFLRWYEIWKGVSVRSAESDAGEMQFENLRLDGFVERPGAPKNLALEVNGCYWHGKMIAVCFLLTILASFADHQIFSVISL